MKLTATDRIFEELTQLRDQNTALNELLATHIAGQADREATHKNELRRRDEDHKNELQLAEARWAAAQIAELKLHRRTLHAEILGREVSNHTDTNTNTNTNTSNITAWKKVAEGLVEFRNKNLINNESHVKRIFAENDAFLAPILAICPNVEILLANVLTNKLTLKINKAWVYPSQNSDISPLQNLTEEEAARLGKSFRKHLLANKEFAVAVDAWRLANTTLQPLFDHSPVFGSIMTAVAKVCAWFVR